MCVCGETKTNDKTKQDSKGIADCKASFETSLLWKDFVLMPFERISQALYVAHCGMHYTNE